MALHFFCQVKTYKTGGTPSLKKYLSYWGQQPVPVFVFLVSFADLNQIPETSEIFVYDSGYMLAENDASKYGKRSPKRDVKNKFMITDISNNKDKMTLEDFLYHHVPWSYGLELEESEQ